MKRILHLILILGCVGEARAQIPVVDVAVLTETITTVAELRRQVSLLLKEVALSAEIKQNTKTHLHRYERALSKRGIIPSEELGTYVRKIGQAYQSTGGLNWKQPDALRGVFPMYQNPADPLESQRVAHEQTMATLQGTLASLQVHSSSVDQAHYELKHLKTELVQAKEPQQMRDVQANLQIMHTRELLLTRQALMSFMNLEAVRAAAAISQKAQERMRYDAFVGQAEWLGSPTRYEVNHFLRMPGTP
ncbi:MAG: hypothetical protein OXE92_05390 [Bacteroidetes bacterium]|nr:hypothetical protein [Bacteroidota bacterium]